MDTTRLDEFCRLHLEQHRLPGFAVAMLGPGGTIFEGGYGHCDREKTRPVDPDTVFGIASMSKSMTALAAAILEQEGKLSYRDPVSRYLPGFSLRGVPRETVLVEHLARHTACLPPLPCLGWSLAFHNVEEPWRAEDYRRRRKNAPSPIATLEDLLAYLRHEAEPLGAPGEYMSYSNEGYALLSAVVDVAAGQPLEQFLQERVFTPLGMTRTVLDLDGSEADRLAGGNRTDLFVMEDGELCHTRHWDVAPPYRGCSAVKSTARDMAKYYGMLAGNGVLEGRTILPPQVVERMVGSRYPTREEGCYCLGLDKRLFRGHVICDHGGGLTGISSKGGFLQGEGYAAVVLCNLEEAPVAAVQNAMYNLAMGLPLDTSHTRLSPAGAGPEHPRFYTGAYLCAESPVPFPLEVDCREGGLAAATRHGESREETRELVYCGEATFVALLPGQPFDCGEVFQFLYRDGACWGVKVGSRIHRKLPRLSNSAATATKG